MREAMREAPDVIMVGEIRSTATVEAAMGFADTGHLVISTLHATGCIQALERLTYLLPADQKDRILMDMSLNINAIIAQRLIPGVNGSYALATEVMVNSPFSSEVIRKGHFQDLKDIIEKGSVDGMHTFDQSLVELYRQGKITRENALEHATSKNNLEWMLNFDKDSKANNDESKSTSKSSGSLLPELD